MARGLTKRTKLVIHLACVRDVIAQERAFPMPSRRSLERVKAEYSQLSKEIIADLLAAHDRDRDRTNRWVKKRLENKGRTH